MKCLFTILTLFLVFSKTFAQEENSVGLSENEVSSSEPSAAPLLRSSKRKEEDKSDAKQVQKKKVISFDDQLIEGETKKPDLFYLLEKRQFNYQRLIKLRENFLPEMEATAMDLDYEGNEN